MIGKHTNSRWRSALDPKRHDYHQTFEAASSIAVTFSEPSLRHQSGACAEYPLDMTNPNWKFQMEP